MKLKKTISVLLAFFMIISTSAFAADFSDVAEGDYYADAVAWAAEQKITQGRGNGIFDPNATVTRAEAVTFLWRMAGEPAPTQTQTFADVESDPGNSWYKIAVQWAVEKGITNGTGNGNFSPKVTCSRGMILTMLYRMEGSPCDEAMKAVVPEDTDAWTLEDLGYALIQSMVEAIRSEDVIKDVKQGDYYELPVIWALMSSVLDKNHVDDAVGEVKPNAPCPRGEMVYFLYRASGDAPMEGAVNVGKIPETVLMDKNGVSVTANAIKPQDTDGAVLEVTVKNGSDKMLRLDADKAYVNTYVIYPQVCIPVESEEGYTFFADAVIEAGETKKCQIKLNALDDMGIESVYEIELQAKLVEVEKGEYGYDYVDDFASGDPVHIKTSIYDENASYDMTGTVLVDKDGLKVLAVKAENNEYAGPQISLYAFNGGSKEVDLEIAEIKLDGEVYEAYFSMTVPAGKRCVSDIFLDYDYENIPVAKEAELTLCTVDPETWDPAETFAPVKIAFTK